MPDDTDLPQKLRDWLRQPGSVLLPGFREFVVAVREFAAHGVGYGFMQQVIEWIWQEKDPIGAWGPEFHSRMQAIQQERAEGLCEERDEAERDRAEAERDLKDAEEARHQVEAANRALQGTIQSLETE